LPVESFFHKTMHQCGDEIVFIGGQRFPATCLHRIDFKQGQADVFRFQLHLPSVNIRAGSAYGWHATHYVAIVRHSVSQKDVGIEMEISLREQFLAETAKQLGRIYSELKLRKKLDMKMKHRTEGYMYAGQQLG